jgi:hypothetical protein
MAIGVKGKSEARQDRKDLDREMNLFLISMSDRLPSL